MITCSNLSSIGKAVSICKTSSYMLSKSDRVWWKEEGCLRKDTIGFMVVDCGGNLVRNHYTSTFSQSLTIGSMFQKLGTNDVKVNLFSLGVFELCLLSDDDIQSFTH